MRRIIKQEDSLAAQMVYDCTNSTKNTPLREILLAEQHNICAYTETYLDRASGKPIEHFDPTLKDTAEDGYKNYFICKTQWNSEKGKVKRWNDHQPILHPTATDLEERITYIEGDYFAADEDESAQNLVKFLKLDDPKLSEERIEYIERKKKEIAYRGIDTQAFFDELIREEPKAVFFIRALQEEFQVSINFDLLEK